jgi:hypothetical protein
MSVWVAGAVVVGAGITAYSASESAEDAQSAASDSADASLGFERQKYNDWKAAYGDIQTNLSDYYNTLTPDMYEAQGLEIFQQEHQAALETARTTLAQRGILDSGIAAQVELQGAQDLAEGRAKIRQEAPLAVEAERLNFLQVGLGLNPGDSLSSALSSEANRTSLAAREAAAASGAATQSAVEAIGTGLSTYFEQPTVDTTQAVDAGNVSANQYTNYSGYV